ncbi:MAG: PAS domain S-box protein, partial [Firmicutes bacterium]|nr:PAS domain S-box protein [Bacillota bacterium]
YRERYIGIWAVSWSVYSLRNVFDLLMLAGQPSAALEIGSRIFFLLSGLLLFTGTCAFLGKTVSKGWAYGPVLVAICIVAGVLSLLPFPLRTLPSSAFLSAIHIYSGLLFIRSRKIEGAGRLVTGWAFIIRGVCILGYPFLRPVLWFAPWEYLISELLKLIIALGILMIYFQKKRKDLSESEARYRAIVEDQTELICRFLPDGTLTFVNEAYCRYFGMNREDFIGRSFFLLFPHEIVKEAEKHIASLSRENPVATIEHRVVMPDGETRWQLWTDRALFDDSGNFVEFQSVGRDITDRKNVEAELARRKEFAEKILQTAGVIIVLLDPEANIISLNRFGEQLTGYSEKEVRGKNWLTALVPERERDKVSGLCKEIISSGSGVHENVIITKEGRELLVRWYNNVLHDVDGRTTTVLAVGHDVTELRAIEAQLRQAQKMGAIGQLAGGIAHDFNNLLTGILGNISLALAETTPGSARAIVLEEAEWAANRAAEITAHLLGFSRKTMLQPRLVNINDCITKTAAILRRTIDPRITIKTCLKPDLWAVHGDPAQIIQIQMNLCLNARDAMPEGGTIVIETGNITFNEDNVYTRPPHGRAGDFVVLSVSDTGSGMPPEVQERIFEPFFTTKEPDRGTGLGLAMVYGIVRQQGGWIECCSELGKGARFTVYLPRFSGNAPGGAGPKLCPREVLSGSETVLLVDDEEMVRNLARKILLRYGYKVIPAEDGLTALDIYRREKEEIDLVLLDLAMPWLSGQDTVKALQEIDGNVKVLISSGYSLKDMGGELQVKGAIGFVHKPYRPADLARAVRQALDAKPDDEPAY